MLRETGAAGRDVGHAAFAKRYACVGDILAVAKVEDLHIGDTVALNANAPKLPPAVYPMPMYDLAVEPKARGDEQKISGSLGKIADEDPTFEKELDQQNADGAASARDEIQQISPTSKTSFGSQR